MVVELVALLLVRLLSVELLVMARARRLNKILLEVEHLIEA